MEIKIIEVNGSRFGVQKTETGIFHEYHERHPYMGYYQSGEIIEAKLKHEVEYLPGNWAQIPENLVENTERATRTFYVDVVK